MTTNDDEPVGDVDHPTPVHVQVGGVRLRAVAHATRTGRRGREVLISHSGRFVWVLADRVRSRTDGEAAP
jgi:hypothetical protein